MKRLWVLPLVLWVSCACAEVCNVKVVTDASPDYTDMQSLVHSITSKWPTPKEKCWAMFYWNHLARRQTAPMELHGMELTDPIRQFNDYGFTMCSTVSGVNNGIWEHMGLKHKFWDICNHTVCEVEYDGKFHMYDNSLSTIYTTCDGKTLAGVAEIGAEGACEASGGKKEIGHIAKYHCLCATSPMGFLSGADTSRSLNEEAGCFNPNGLKFRTYYYNWDFGHRYILNLKDGEVYTRFYRSLGKEPKYWVPNPGIGGKDPESVNERYHIRGNGIWKFKPALNADFAKIADSATDIAAGAAGLQPAKAGTPATVVFKVQAANVITAQNITGAILRKTADDSAKISISTTNGLRWKDVWKADGTGELPVKVDLLAEVNGAYEVLVKIELQAKAAEADAALKALEIETTTEVNSKTQPRLNLGKNTIYVGTGEQTEAIVFWPDLQGDKYKELVVEEKNMASAPKHGGYHGILHPATPGDAYVVYRIDTPTDMTRLVYGGRFYPRAGDSKTEIQHSFDGGKTWTTAWSTKATEQPWDVIRYETVTPPKGVKSALVKYFVSTKYPDDTGFGCSIYALRIEANYVPADTTFKPVEATFTWKEVQKDRKLVERSHTQLIAKVPFKYTLNTGGEDQPVMESLRLNLQGAAGELKSGYSDGKDAGGERFVGKWQTVGRNLAVGKPYTVSVPSGNNWGAGDPEGKKLTDGSVGPNYAGGTTPGTGLIWDKGTPEVTVDLGKDETCAAFRIHMTAGWPWWDAFKGEVQDKVEVLTSADNKEYKSQGILDFNVWHKDVPVNFMVPDDETLTGYNFELVPAAPVSARYVRFKIEPKRSLVVTEVQVLDSLKYEPFDLRIALPDEK